MECPFGDAERPFGDAERPFGDTERNSSFYIIILPSISNSSELSLHIVGGYGILAIPTKSAEQSWQSGYGRDAIPSYRLPLIYKDNYEHILIIALTSINS